MKALVENCFKDDPEAAEKQRVLSQAAGCVALAYNTHLTQPKGIILHGPSANNGKSQFLEVYKALVPKEAVCALSLARLGDDRYIPLLAGKLLNCSAETPSAAILGSDVLKAVITGEEISGREVRRRVVKFKPVATHVIASNRLPSFEGMDRSGPGF